MADKGDFDALLGRTERYASQVKRLYEEAVKELLAIGKDYDFAVGKDGSFTFDQTKKMDKRTEKVLRKLQSAVKTAIERGITLEWDKANDAWDKVVKNNITAYKTAKSPMLAAMMERNNDALQSFLNRVDSGMNLSDRVWKYSEQLRGEMEAAISVSIGEGESAATISRRVRQYLNEPDKLFRRVRNKKTGKLELSKAAKAYHPGQGVYRSSYKNAMRLARTETNMAYRTADQERREHLDFVLGIKINLSKDHPVYDICDELKGNYPTDFKFTGWHPQCFCYSTSILLSDEEFIAYNKALIKGEKYEIKGKIKDVPKAFKDWVSDNKEKIEKAAEGGKLPYFLRDNRKYWDETYEPPVKELTIQERAAIRHAQRTPEQIQVAKDYLAKKQKANDLSRYVVGILDGIDGVSLNTLKELMKHSDYDAILQEAKRLDATIKEIQSLDRLDNPFDVAKATSLSDAKLINSAVERTLSKMPTNLADRKSKLEFEIDWMEREGKRRYPATYKFSQDAYRKELAIVVEKIKWQDIDRKLDELKRFRNAYAPTDADLSNLINLAEQARSNSSSSLSYVTSLVANAEQRMNQLENIKREWDDVDARISLLKSFDYGRSKKFKEELDAVLDARSNGSSIEQVKVLVGIAEYRMKDIIYQRRASGKSNFKGKTLEELKLELGDRLPKTLRKLDKSIAKYTRLDRDFVNDQDAINEAMLKLFENNDYGMDINTSYLESVYSNGFYNTFQSGSSKGYLGSLKTTGKIETNHARLRCSHELFLGDQPLDDQLERKEYEKYGHLLDRDMTQSWEHNLTHYGNCQVRFKKDKVLCTWTLDDSLGETYQPSLTTDPQVCSFDRMLSYSNRPTLNDSEKPLYKWQRDKGTSYVELQYHGDLTIDDVESIVFGSNPKNILSQDLINKLLAKGIKLYYYDGNKVVLYQ